MKKSLKKIEIVKKSSDKQKQTELLEKLLETKKRNKNFDLKLFNRLQSVYYVCKHNYISYSYKSRDLHCVAYFQIWKTSL